MAQGTTVNVVNGAVTQYGPGPRAGEDILMSNVLAFDIKVWDPAAGPGPDGHPGIAGYVNPTTTVKEDDDGDGFPDNPAEYGWPGSDDGDWKDIGHPGVTFGQAAPTVPGFYAARMCLNTYYCNLSGNPGATPPVRPTNRYDTWGPAVDIDGVPGADRPPYRPFAVGVDHFPGSQGDDDNNGIVDFLPNGYPDPGELGWPGSDDVAMPLTAIKITIRFYDVTSNQVRDVSTVYRLRFEQ
jgi:hypothetical protein